MDHPWAGAAGPIMVPNALAASHHTYFGKAGRPWIAALPRLAQSCLDRWELRLDGDAGWGAVALVLPVTRADGSRAVLKLQPVDEETRGEAAALRCWAGVGAVRLLEHDAGSGSMVLDRLDASRPLAAVADDLAAVQVIAELLVGLNSLSAPGGLRRLAEIATAMLAQVPKLLRLLRDPAERRLLASCADRLRELLVDPVNDRLLHWDLHYNNVLASVGSPQAWLAIDPKPLAGDPGFELLPALWNRWDDVVATGEVRRAVLRRFDLMTEIMGLDRTSATVWTLARVLQNALWDVGKFADTALEPSHRAIAESLLEVRVDRRPRRHSRLSRSGAGLD
jgi:streptomycin 6-kinase